MKDLLDHNAKTRPLFVSDCMIIIAASGLAISLAAVWQRQLSEELSFFFNLNLSTPTRARFAGHALAVLLPASLTVLALRLRRPRPRIWLIARQPGAIACIASTLALAGLAATLPLDLRTMGGLTSPLLVAAFYWPTAVGVVVLASWLILALSRRWRARGDWVDRAGMLVGVGWIGLPLALAVIELELW